LVKRSPPPIQDAVNTISTNTNLSFKCRIKLELKQLDQAFE
jgi:hypothetical protein